MFSGGILPGPLKEVMDSNQVLMKLKSTLIAQQKRNLLRVGTEKAFGTVNTDMVFHLNQLVPLLQKLFSISKARLSHPRTSYQ